MRTNGISPCMPTRGSSGAAEVRLVPLGWLAAQAGNGRASSPPRTRAASLARSLRRLACAVRSASSTPIDEPFGVEEVLPSGIRSTDRRWRRIEGTAYLACRSRHSASVASGWWTGRAREFFPSQPRLEICEANVENVAAILFPGRRAAVRRAGGFVREDASPVAACPPRSADRAECGQPP